MGYSEQSIRPHLVHCIAGKDNFIYVDNTVNGSVNAGRDKITSDDQKISVYSLLCVLTSLLHISHWLRQPFEHFWYRSHSFHDSAKWEAAKKLSALDLCKHNLKATHRGLKRMRLFVR